MPEPRATRRKRIAWLLPVLLLAFGTSVAVGWPWSVDMVWQVALRPFDYAMQPPPLGTLPVVGGELQTDERKPLHIVPPAESSLEEGRQLYDIYCTVCHGADALGGGPVGVKFPIEAPSLLLERTEEYIYERIRGGSVFMPSYAEQLSPAEAWAVVKYIKSLEAERNGQQPAEPQEE